MIFDEQQNIDSCGFFLLEHYNLQLGFLGRSVMQLEQLKDISHEWWQKVFCN